MQESLNQIVENTKQKTTSIQLIVSSDKTTFSEIFDVPINLDPERKHEIALLNLETYYSIPNIDKSNNIIKYQTKKRKRKRRGAAEYIEAIRLSTNKILFIKTKEEIPGHFYQEMDNGSFEVFDLARFLQLTRANSDFERIGQLAGKDIHLGSSENPGFFELFSGDYYPLDTTVLYRRILFSSLSIGFKIVGSLGNTNIYKDLAGGAPKFWSIPQSGTPLEITIQALLERLDTSTPGYVAGHAFDKVIYVGEENHFYTLDEDGRRPEINILGAFNEPTLEVEVIEPPDDESLVEGYVTIGVILGRSVYWDQTRLRFAFYDVFDSSRMTFTAAGIPGFVTYLEREIRSTIERRGESDRSSEVANFTGGIISYRRRSFYVDGLEVNFHDTLTRILLKSTRMVVPLGIDPAAIPALMSEYVTPKYIRDKNLVAGSPIAIAEINETTIKITPFSESHRFQLFGDRAISYQLLFEKSVNELNTYKRIGSIGHDFIYQGFGENSKKFFVNPSPESTSSEEYIEVKPFQLLEDIRQEMIEKVSELESNTEAELESVGEPNWEQIQIPTGSYDITDINSYIQSEMKKRGHYDEVNEEFYITIGANSNTLKATLNIMNKYKVKFGSLRKVLGFERKIYNQGYYESELEVNIMSINSILVSLDIVAGSFVNGKTSNVIYSFFPNANPGYKILEKPINLVYLPISTNRIRAIYFRLTDQNEKKLNNRGETITMRFHIREV